MLDYVLSGLVSYCSTVASRQLDSCADKELNGNCVITGVYYYDDCVCLCVK